MRRCLFLVMFKISFGVSAKDTTVGLSLDNAVIRYYRGDDLLVTHSVHIYLTYIEKCVVETNDCNFNVALVRSDLLYGVIRILP